MSEQNEIQEVTVYHATPAEDNDYNEALVINATPEILESIAQRILETKDCGRIYIPLADLEANDALRLGQNRTVVWSSGWDWED